MQEEITPFKSRELRNMSTNSNTMPTNQNKHNSFIKTPNLNNKTQQQTNFRNGGFKPDFINYQKINTDPSKKQQAIMTKNKMDEEFNNISDEILMTNTSEQIDFFGLKDFQNFFNGSAVNNSEDVLNQFRMSELMMKNQEMDV